jgi:hypothetical protein
MKTSTAVGVIAGAIVLVTASILFEAWLPCYCGSC